MKTKKRIRRTKKVIEDSIWNELESAIAKKGFCNITQTDLLKGSKIDAYRFSKHFNNLHDFLDKFIREYDYWLSDVFTVARSTSKNSNVQLNSEFFLINLIDSLKSNLVVQKLLIWELCESNVITNRSIKNREINSENSFDFIQSIHSDSELNIRVFMAIMIGGIYYLILSSDRSILCGIDFSTIDGIEMLKDSIKTVTERVFLKKEYNGKINNKNEMEIAQKLLTHKVDKHIISDSTGLSMRILAKIESKIKAN